MTAFHRSALTTCVCTALAAAVAVAQTDPRARRLQGTWDLVSLEQAGEKVADAAVRGRALTIGGQSYMVRQGNAVLQAGVISTPAAGDKRVVNVTILQGQDSGSFLLGIYQLADDTLTLCFDAGGVNRPNDIRSAEGGKQSVAVYKRRKAAKGGADDLAGVYISQSDDGTGRSAKGQAIIERQGDAYQVIYQSGGGIAFVGVGVREGDVFSVCWRNQGQFGISVYRVEKGRMMRGRYTILGGNGQINEESLTPDDGV